MRTLLAFIICLTLAFQGVANAITVEAPCPMAKGMMDKGKAHSAAGHAGMMHEMHMGMEMDMEMEMKSSMDDISQEHDCCNDLETFLKTGQMCKTSQTCSASGAGLLTAALSVSVVPSTTDFLPDIPPSLRSAHPIGVWRPPTIS